MHANCNYKPAANIEEQCKQPQESCQKCIPLQVKRKIVPLQRLFKTGKNLSGASTQAALTSLLFKI